MTTSREPSPRHGGGTEGNDSLSRALSYVPRVLVSALTTHPSAVLPWSDAVEGTLVMGDISGFTAMSELLAKAGREGAERLTDIITSFFASMLGIAREFGGDTITYGGDAVLVLFDGPEHAARAVQASLEMLETTRGLPPFDAGRSRIRLGMSMGAHTAMLPVFGAGTQTRAQFFILGPDTVRTAEAEALANSGELVVSTATLMACPGLRTVEAGDGLHRVEGLARKPGRVDVEASGATVPAAALRPYLPPFVSDALSTGRRVSVPDSDHRKASIVFVNVSGADEILAESHEVFAAELQDYMAALLRLLERHAGYLVSNDIYTNGFKLILAFGAPVAHEHDAQNAARFSAELLAHMAARGSRLRQRIGLHRGPVFSGDVGPVYRRQYTVMGDAVNLAARLMSAAEIDTALASCDTIAAAGTGFETHGLDPIRVKGKSQPIAVCRLVGEAAGATAAPAHARGELLGRGTEMEALLHAASRALKGRPSSVAIFGEPGIGKSRLAEEFLDRLRSQQWAVRPGAAQEHTSATPFAVWLPIQRALLGIDVAEDQAARARGLALGIDRLAPRLRAYACVLGELFDAPVGETDQARALDEAARRDVLFDLMTEVMVGAARVEPTTIYLDDMHWADSSSIELLERLARTPTAGASLLVVLTSRPGFSSESAIRAVATDSIDVGRLSPEQALDLATALLGVSSLPPAFANTLIDRAKGNPLFVQEVARGLAQAGVLKRLRGASAMMIERELAAIEMPDRVQGLLLSRIDRLEPEPREVLRTAAVVGARFRAEDLETIADDAFVPRQEVARHLQALVGLEFLEPPSAPGQAYRFAHPLIQEVAYASLRFARRRALHHAYAAHLEIVTGGADRFDEIVLHYSRSGDDAKTSTYAVLAASRAGRLFAHHEAVDYYQVALGAVKGPGVQATLARGCIVERIGDSQQAWGHYREAVRAYRDALERLQRARRRAPSGPVGTAICPDLDDAPWEMRVPVLCRKIAVAYERGGSRYDLADEWLDRALASLPNVCSAERAQALITRGFSAMRQGRYSEAVRWGARGLAEARGCGDATQRAWALNMLGTCYREMGDLKRAISHERQAVALLEGQADLNRLAAAHGNLASCYQMLGDLERARVENERSLELEVQVGSIGGAAISRINLAEIAVAQGHIDLAVTLLDTSIGECEEAGSVGLLGFACLIRARAARMACDLRTAWTHIDKSIALLTRANARAAVAEAFIEAAEIALAEGDLEKAGQLIARVCGGTSAIDSRIVAARAERARGRLLRLRSKPREALAATRNSIELARGAHAGHELGLSLLALGELLEEDRRPDAALDAADEAHRLLRKAGAGPDLATARALRRRLHATK